MSYNLLVKNSHLIASKAFILNLYVTEDELSIRLLKESDSDINSNLSPLSHEKNYKESAKPDHENPIKTLGYKGKKYDIFYESGIKLKDIKQYWKAGQVVLICTPSAQAMSYKYPDTKAIPLYAYTYTTKDSIKDFTNILRSFADMGAFLRFYPLKNQNFLSSPCQLYCDSPESLITNLNFDSVVEKNNSEIINNFYNSVTPQVLIKGPSFIKEDSTENLEVEVLLDGELLQEDLTLKVECVDGYAPHTRIDTHQGKGNFTVTALGLKSGDSMRIKLNDGFYTSKAEHIFKVIA